MTDLIEDFSQPDVIDALASTRLAAVGGAALSIHNPANQMVDDLTSQVEPKPAAPTTHQSPGDDTAPAFVKMFMEGITRLTDRFDTFEARLTAVERGKQQKSSPPLPAQPPQISVASKPSTTKDPRVILPAPTQRPAPDRENTTQAVPRSQPTNTPVTAPVTTPATTSATTLPPLPIPLRPDPTPVEVACKGGKSTTVPAAKIATPQLSRPLSWWVLHGRGCVLH